MSTTFILGAGASHGSDFRLPTTNDLLAVILAGNRYEHSYRWNAPEDIVFLREFVRVNFPDPDQLHIEELLTFLDCGSTTYGQNLSRLDEELHAYAEPLSHAVQLGITPSPKEKTYSDYRPQDIARVKRTLLRQIVDALQHRPCEGRMYCEKHSAMFRHLKQTDSIITLNYDLIVEETIQHLRNQAQQSKPKPSCDDFHHVRRMEESISDHVGPMQSLPFSLPLRDFIFGQVIHLHGAINWLSCMSPDCSNHFRIMYGGNMHELRMDEAWICRTCGSPLTPVIVPPTMTKDLDRYAKLNFLWTAASLALRRTSHLVIVGCSFQPSDYFLRHLLRTSLAHHRYLKRVDFVAWHGAKSALANFQSSLAFRPWDGLVHVYDEGLDEYVTKGSHPGDAPDIAVPANSDENRGTRRRSTRTASPPRARRR